MSENNLKLWNCYPKNNRVESFSRLDENTVSESYEQATENFGNTEDKWDCVPANNLENFSNSDNNSKNENKPSRKNRMKNWIKKMRISLFGEDEYSDCYFYASIVALIFIFILLIRK
jgi:hypothetical protein